MLFGLAMLAMLALPGMATSGAANAQVSVGISVGFAPPELPVYEQPICPGEGYIWTPGYWAWDGDDYYWVPGTWVEAPQPGYLWTPAYWGWGGSAFIFHEGYWGQQVGFYGGINYGFGYSGRGYEGGRWDGGRFFYNRSVNNVNVTVIHNVYETRVVNNYNVTRVSYNGGNGGINGRATAAEEAAARERHVGEVQGQRQQVEAARANRELRASANHGKPPVAATPRAGSFNGGVAAREGGNYNPPNRGANNNGANNNGANNAEHNNVRPNAEANAARNNTTFSHAKDIPAANRPDRPNTGNAKTDQKYQQQQQKLYQQQQQDHQKMQQKQDQDHQRIEQQKSNDARKQQVEQKHQQQTQQMEQKHTQQQQKMEQKQQPKQPKPQPQKSQPQPRPTGEKPH